MPADLSFFQNTTVDLKFIRSRRERNKVFLPVSEMKKVFSISDRGRKTINILPSFAESRQIEVIAWKLLALLATAVSVLRKLPFAVCALPSGRERQKGVFWQLFRPEKLPSPHLARGGLLHVVAIRTDYTLISFKGFTKKNIKPRKK